MLESKNVDNVIILGAGASFDAGIPLMNSFVEKIRQFAFKSLGENSPLTDADKTTFGKAIKIMNNLDSYHARAAFDDHNLEDILSILAFNILGGKSYTKVKLDDMIESIAKTIELTCNVKHNGKLNVAQHEGNIIYRDFWNHLFNKFDVHNTFPTIVTLNYDLVLERSLLQTLVTTEFKKHSFDGIVLQYHYPGLEDVAYKLIMVNYRDHEGDFFKDKPGYALEVCSANELIKPVMIEILKLHGSLNFPKRTTTSDSASPDLTKIVESPYIIPPISNKSLSLDSEKTWRSALERIGQCKNLYIVGYSLPKTDVYFQFFLKAALGPNHDFEKMFIFNPALFSNEGRSEIKNRYENCFPEQLHNRIVFYPEVTSSFEGDKGSFAHFVNEIKRNESFFF